MDDRSQPATETLMLREITEQADALRRTITSAGETARRIAAEVVRRDIDLIIIAARGTSDHAALYAQYLFQYLNQIPVALATPSIYTLYGASPRVNRALVIGISQSGESPDVVEVISKAGQTGAFTIAITNMTDAPLARAAHDVLALDAGAERSVAATKTYTSTCVALALLAAALPGGERLGDSVDQVPALVEAALRCRGAIERQATRYTHARDCVVLGRGFQYSTARETALKLEETCYVLATPFSTADFRHGPAALVERGMPVIVFAPPGRTSDQSLELLHWLRDREADSVVIAQEERLLDLATTPIRLDLPAVDAMSAGMSAADVARPSVDELLAPIPYIVPGQLFAQYLALRKGLNPDQPRSLSKVTRTH